VKGESDKGVNTVELIFYACVKTKQCNVLRLFKKRGEDKKVIEGVILIKTRYIHVWKYHKEINPFIYPPPKDQC
jgi:hypothetical protein